MIYRSAVVMGIILVVVLSASSVVSAQESDASFREDLRVQPYLTGSIGAFPSGAGGGLTYGLGFGADFLAVGGLGFGGDLAIFGSNAYGFSVLSFNTSYHFIRESSRLVPFIKGGIGTGGEVGYGGVTFGSFGGGVNLWNLGGSAVRIEVVDHFPIEGGDHHLNVQLGLTF